MLFSDSLVIVFMGLKSQLGKIKCTTEKTENCMAGFPKKVGRRQAQELKMNAILFVLLFLFKLNLNICL